MQTARKNASQNPASGQHFCQQIKNSLFSKQVYKHKLSRNCRGCRVSVRSPLNSRPLRGNQTRDLGVEGSTARLPVFTHHGHGVGGQQLLGTHGGDVGDVSKHVDEGDQGDGDEDGPGQVPGKAER